MKIVVTVEFPGEIDRERAAGLIQQVAEDVQKGQYVRASWKEEGDADAAWLSYAISVSQGDGVRPTSE